MTSTIECPPTLHLGGLDPHALIADYGDVTGEVYACRHACALFDFSFLAIAEIRGEHAIDAIDALTGRGSADFPVGRIRYALRSREDGTLISDLTIWRLTRQRYQLMSGSWGDINDLTVYCTTHGIECRDLTLETAVLALQGPLALRALTGMANVEQVERIGYFEHTQLDVAGVPCRVGRLGYTGERGLELLCPANRFSTLWGALASVARPAGFAAADCLRIEAGFPLFTNEFRLAVTATEAGLARFSVTSGDNERVRLVCFGADCEQTPRLWCPPTDAQLPCKRGTISITSAARSTLAEGILGLGYVLAEDVHTNSRIEDPRGEFYNLSVVPLPYYDRDKRRPRDHWS